MKISGGLARGINLRSPKGDATRPATGGIREALFSHLGDQIVRARVVDLFAGTGAYGLEALSRGASAVTWVEQAPAAISCLVQNVAAVERAIQAAARPPTAGTATDGGSNLGAMVPTAPVTAIVKRDVLRWEGPGFGADLIIADPPYATYETSLQALLETVQPWLRAGGLLALENPGGLQFPPHWVIHRELRRNRHGPGITLLKIAEGAIA